MTDKPYQGRRGGRYVRASRDEEPRRVDEAASVTAADAAADEAGAEDATIPETTRPETGSTGKPARKRN